MTQAQQRLRAIEALGAKLPPHSDVRISMDWERGPHDVGVTASAGTFTVWFCTASVDVETAAEAEEILRGIFADEIVWVTGYSNGEPVYSALGRAEAPMTLISTLDRNKSSIELPRIDDVDVVRWSSS